MTNYYAKNQLIKARFHYEMRTQPLVIYFECQIRVQMNIYEPIWSEIGLFWLMKTEKG